MLCCDCEQPPLSVLGRRYSHMDMPKLTPDDVKRRVMAVCRSFEKISEEEVSLLVCYYRLTCLIQFCLVMLGWCGICCGQTSVHSSVASQCSIKTVKHIVTQSRQHPTITYGLLFSDAKDHCDNLLMSVHHGIKHT